MSAEPNAVALVLPQVAEHPRGRRRVRRLAGLALPGLVLLIFLITGLFAPLLAPKDPKELVLVERMQPPVWQAGGTWDHPLGTDNVGRDILSRLIYGARISLLVI